MEGKELNIKATKMYEFDFDKIKTVEQVIELLKGLQISFSENFAGIKQVRHLIKEKNPENSFWTSTATTDKTIKWDL
jgi:hypothetical protein